MDDTPKNILEIKGSDGAPLVTITHDGEFIAHQPEKMTEAAGIFWDSMTQLISAANNVSSSEKPTPDPMIQ